mmetsp:Transcript_6984/g.14865  ORF Transcript_6984/g.14865 Transcript_6984/m.14865 type:complete len:590 (-) Transcript_6984:58-1827(-)
MRNSSFGSKEKSGWKIGGETTDREGHETDSLLRRGSATASSTNHQSSSRRSSSTPDSSNLRERRPSRSSSPIAVSLFNQRFGGPSGEKENQLSTMNASLAADPVPDSTNFNANSNIQNDNQPTSSYTQIRDEGSRSGNVSVGGNSAGSYQNSMGGGSRSLHSLRRSHRLSGRDEGGASAGEGSGNSAPLLEIPEEIYRVRRAALQVLKPLTRTWLIVSIGFALTVLLGMARWINLLSNLPYWFILLPSWLSHLGLFWCHISSAKALSSFIADANESRQRPDSSDHLDRTEYLPLLQRSLKFGLKTGLISFGIFIFEILFYLRLANGKLSMISCFMPIWIMVFVGIIDGIICRTQHILRLISWVLIFTAMVLLCLKLDYHHEEIQWRMIVCPIVMVLSIASASLIYIVYGHQVGYYQLTESQLTAGNLYSLAALLSIVLVVVIGEIIPLNRHVDIATAIFVVSMAPIVVVLVGMGAWVVSRNEFGRLLLYGGQAQVHPRRLRFDANGWTGVQGSGVKNIPMFGEVSFRPLNRTNQNNIELCMCCTCYPREEDEEDIAQHINDVSHHPYLAPVSSESTPYTQWQSETQPAV